MPFDHECDFDHRSAHKASIKKANPVVKNDQFQRI
jgi:hypothetical protein